VTDEKKQTFTLFPGKMFVLLSYEDASDTLVNAFPIEDQQT